MTEVLADVRTLWHYLVLREQPRRCDVAIVFGSHDLAVAGTAAALYHAGWFARLVCTGATAPTTVERFPRGEAVHFREQAIALGVPAQAILVEPHARNTNDNVRLARDVLCTHGIHPATAMLVSRPYQQRRTWATARHEWPELTVVCAAQRIELADYLAQVGDADLVINTMVADTQRIRLLPSRGLAAAQAMPDPVWAAYERLVAAGYDRRVIR